MGRLTDFLKYLDGRLAVVVSAERRLCAVQGRYESYFAEIRREREEELQQLTAHILDGPERIPAWLVGELETMRLAVEREFAQEIERFSAEHAALAEEAERVRAESLEAEKAIRAKNVDLDRREEMLKQKNQALLEDIEAYNRRIRELGSGFGFLANFFQMRGLRAERRELDALQEDAAGGIEGLRATWVTREAEYAAAEVERQRYWTELKTRAAGLQAKIDHLRETEPRIVLRTTVERVLFDHAPAVMEAGADDSKCPRCAVPNPVSNHFCQICAARLGTDRPDAEGSLEEIAELNLHHRRFGDGLKACQQIIGLVRGLSSGITAFRKSVAKVYASECKYPLPKLSIEVPAWSVAFGKHFDALNEALASDLSLHPVAFAASIGKLIDGVYTEANIQRFFETMGAELSKQAKSQW